MSQPAFGGNPVNVGPQPPTAQPTTPRPTRAPIPFGSNPINIGPRPPTPTPTISSFPSEQPTISSMPSPSATNHPTPSQEFPYRPYGDSAFGQRWYDFYYDAYQHSIRRAPGWSWGQYESGPGPFCYAKSCFDVTSVCSQFGGILLHEYVCSFPPDVIVAGPSCWQGECISEGAQTCGSAGGVAIGAADGTGGPQWCVFSGSKSLVGPTCYNSDCFDSQLALECADEGGTLWNDRYCILNGLYTVVGPICWNVDCQLFEAEQKCSDLNGILFARRWCAFEGCDKTVVGPTCSMIPQSVTDQCYDISSLCNNLGGTNIGNKFCVLDGTEWTLIGPTVFNQDENVAQTSNFCTQLKQPQLQATISADDATDRTGRITTDVNGEITPFQAYFSSLESYDIDGRFCLVNEKIPTTTPFCGGISINEGVPNGCDLQSGRDFCNRFGGKVLADGFMCSLCDSFLQVVGPMTWNGTLLEGDPEYCEGAFCAIPNEDASINGTTANPRCPSGRALSNRCEAFGGARGIGLFDDDTNSTNTTDDDVGPLSSALMRGISYSQRWAVASVLFASWIIISL